MRLAAGLRPEPLGEVTALPRPPAPAGFCGKGQGKEETRREGRRGREGKRERRGEEREGKGEGRRRVGTTLNKKLDTGLNFVRQRYSTSKIQKCRDLEN